MRLASPGARAALSAAGIIVVTTTCQLSDVLKSPGVADVAVSFAGDTVLVVAAPVRPVIGVTVNGAAYEGARVLLATSDTAIVAVHGDTLVPKRRGAVTLTATLESSTLPRNPPSLTQALTVVADTVTLDSAAVRLTSLGDTVTLVATARDAAGAALTGAAARWASSDTAVVGVSPSGRLAARGNGTATVRVMVDRDTAAATVTVAQALVRWTFEPASLRIDALAATGSVTATGRDARGASIAALAPTAWSVGDPLIATVSAPGQVTSLLNGATYLYAVRGSVRDSASVTVAQRAVLLAVTPKPVPGVTSLGAQVQLIARAFDRRGVELQGARPAWFTLEPAAVRVSTDGLVTALATGSARVIAALDAAADTVTVLISNDPASVAIAPDSAVATSLGDTLVFRAVARNGRGDSVAAVLTWRTPDSTVVRLLGDGRAIAVAVGTARMVVTVGGRADTALARVTNVPVVIDITPASRLYTSLGDVDTLPVTVSNARGAALPRGAVTWTSDDATIARVNGAGIVTARDTGQTVVRATSGALTDSVLVAVTNVPASVVILGSASDSLTAVGQSLSYGVEVRNARNALIPDYAVAWQSTSRATVDTVLPTGVAVAVGWGTAHLIARAGAVADTATVTVFNPTRLYVSNAVSTGLRVGTVARPYAKIQDGVNAADAGDTVVVLRGVSPYSESVALARRVVLLGDSAGYAAGHDPALLPQVAHDTGAAGITAYTTAPVTIRYLALTHSLDGPAIDTRGSDVVVADLHVNRPGSVSSRIGRGIRVANSTSGTRIERVYVDSVRGYGIRLENASGAIVQAASVRGVDSLPGVAAGAGIEVSGGSGNTARGNVVRATQGPRVLVTGSTGATVFGNDLAGSVRQVRLVNAPLAQVGGVFDLARQAGDDGGSSGTDGRAGIEVVSSPQTDIASATFTDPTADAAPMDGVSFLDTRGARVDRSSFAGGRVQLISRRSSVFIWGSRFDSAFAAVTALEADTVSLVQDTAQGNQATSPCVLVLGASPAILIQQSLLQDCGGAQVPALSFDPSAGGTLTLDRVTSLGRQGIAVWMSGGSTVTVSGGLFSGAARTGVPQAAALSLHADTVRVTGARVSDYAGEAGVSVELAQVAEFSQDLITRNAIGIALHSLSAFTPSQTDVFDNSGSGVWNEYPAVSRDYAGIWFGDGRGPRRAAALAAAGDSVVGVDATVSYTASPYHTGTQPAALRVVRGDGQSAAAGATLAQAFTIRVVDADGLPVSGVSVQFSVTGGNGKFGGQNNVTVTTNASGLAEATLTLGASAGANTVKVSSGGGVRDTTLAATGT